jgi:hypothetical protein
MAIPPESDDYASTHGHDAAYAGVFAYDYEYTAKVTDANDIKE